jgi:hypothetical protein
MASQRVLYATIFCSTVGFVVTPDAARSAESQFGAHVRARVARSDNIALALAGFEQDERVAEVTTGFSFRRSESRIEADVTYQVQGVFYDTASDLNETRHTLDASSRLTLLVDRLFLDTFAVQDQTLVDPAGKYSFNRLALTGNRTDMLAVGMSPALSLAMGSNITGELRFSAAEIDYDDPALEQSTERSASFTLGNNVSRGGSWRVNYSQQRYDYDVSGEVEIENFNAELGFWVGPAVRLFTTQGLESDYTLVFDNTPGAPSPGLDDHYWNIGTEWRPTARSTVVATTGERNFGRARSLTWDYVAAAGGGINLTYSEEPSSFVRENLRTVRRTGELAPIDALEGAGGNLFFLQKRVGAAFVLNRRRSTIGLHLFNDRRFDIEQATLTGEYGDEIERYRGAEVTWGWRINSVANLDVVIHEAQRRSTINSVNDELSRVGLNWGRRIGRQNQLTFTVAREQAKPGAGTVGQNDYTENQLSVGISRWFASDMTQGIPKRFSGYLNAPAAL